MKRLVFILLAFLFLLLCIPVSAHPGRTDEDGGHYDRSTGEYHWHHGYEAHQHYDMDGDGDIDCPYNFNVNPYSSLHNGKTKVEFNTSESADKANDSLGGDEKVDWFEVAYPFIIVAAIVTIFVLGRIISSKNEEIKKLNITIGLNEKAMSARMEEERSKYRRLLISHSDQEKQLQGKIEKLKNEYIEYQDREYLRVKRAHETIDKLKIKYEGREKQLQFEINTLKIRLLQNNRFNKQDFIAVYGEDYIRDFLHIPEDDYIGIDGLPASDDGLGLRWGKKYTRFITESTKRYHTADCWHAYEGKAINAFEIRYIYGATPCSICRPDLPDMEWVLGEKILTKFTDSFFVDKDNAMDKGSEEDQDLQ